MIKLNKATWMFIVNDLNTSVRDWYCKTYPDDDLGKSILSNMTFWDLVAALNAGLDVYKFLGVADSVVRERVFARIAKLAVCDYDDVYDTWMAAG